MKFWLIMAYGNHKSKGKDGKVSQEEKRSPSVIRGIIEQVWDEENNRGGQDFIHWKIVTEMGAKKNLPQASLLPELWSKSYFFAGHRQMTRLFPRLKWFHLVVQSAMHALLFRICDTHSSLVVRSWQPKLTRSRLEGTSKPRSRSSPLASIRFWTGAES